VKTPRLPEYATYARHHSGKRHRCLASPDDGPARACGARALQRAPHHQGVESEPARGESSDGRLAIALGGFQLQVCTAFWEGGVDRPALWVTLDKRRRLHGEVRGQEIRVTVSPWTSRDVSPSDFDDSFPNPGPVPRARDDRDVSGASPLPRSQEAGARGRVRHDRWRGSAFLAVDARASQWGTRARGRRLGQRGIPIKRADHGEVTAGVTAQSRRLAGARARVAHDEAVAIRKPAHQARQQPPSHGRRRLMPRPVPTIPRRGAGQGHQDGEGPGPRGDWQLHAPRHDDPLMAPALGRIAVRRPPAIALPSLAQHLGARMRGDCIVARQEHRPRRDHMVPPARDQGASPGPRRPATRGQHAMRGSYRPRCLRPHGASPVGDGPSPWGQHGRQHQDQKPRIRRGGNRGPKHGESRPHPSGNVHGREPSRGFTTASLPGVLAAISPSKILFPHPLPPGSGSQGQKSS
jgi:hypothetical protein